MLDTLESVSRSKLAALKAGNAEYAALLETDFGRYFEVNVGDADTLRLDAVLSASDTAGPPGRLEEPYYVNAGDGQSAGGSAAKDVTPPPITDPAMRPGLGCLLDLVDGSRLTLGNKLRVLNCLVFSMPHSFWVAGENGVRDAEALRTDDRWDWIGTGDWGCSVSPDGPLPSCLKHDAAYSSLKKFAGVTVGSVSNGLDEAWNPRNKALADIKFRADIRAHGCQDASAIAEGLVCPPVNLLLIFSNGGLANLYYWGVTRHVTQLGWPTTTQDIHHARLNDDPRFIICESPHIPTTSNLNASRDGSVIEVSWDFQPGCVVGLKDVSSFDFEWDYATPGITSATFPKTASSVGSEACTASLSGVSCSHRFDYPAPLVSELRVHGVAVSIVPRDREHGNINYPHRGYRIGPF